MNNLKNSHIYLFKQPSRSGKIDGIHYQLFGHLVLWYLKGFDGSRKIEILFQEESIIERPEANKQIKNRQAPCALKQQNKVSNKKKFVNTISEKKNVTKS